jgi:hypothetical protein
LQSLAIVLKDYVPQYGWDDFMRGYGKTNAENLQELLHNPSPEVIESLGNRNFNGSKITWTAISGCCPVCSAG